MSVLPNLDARSADKVDIKTWCCCHANKSKKRNNFLTLAQFNLLELGLVWFGLVWFFLERVVLEPTRLHNNYTVP
jgi:hypothetical protein